MRNHIKAWNLVSKVLFLIVFAASLGVFYLTRTGEGLADFLINLVFAFISAAFLVGYFIGCARPLVGVASALNRVTENILRSPEDTKSLWSRFSQNDKLFANDRLDERYRAYLREVRRMQRQNALTADCRVEDYISEDLIYSTVNKPFCDQLGGIMSGLGILFTFIGLVYGLRHFDASTVDVMQTSTQALMAGIKIAFLTSIFGLIYSLLFGLTYKKLLKDSLEALYDFQDAFTDSVRPVNEHAAENAMLRMQAEQKAALENFGQTVGGEVGEAVVTLMRPAIDTLQSTITQYVNVAIEDQRAGMERVVRYFLSSMDSSLGNIFTQLKTRTEELARWEKDLIDSITVMTAGVGQTARQLDDARENAEKIAATMSAYTGSVAELTAAQQDAAAQIHALAEDYGRSRRQEETYLQALVTAADAAAENTRESRKTAETVASIAAGLRASGKDSAEELSAAGQQITRAAASIRAMADAVTADMNTAAARLAGTARDLDSGLTRTVSDSLALTEESLGRLNGSIEAINAAYASVAQVLRSLPRTVSDADGDIRASAKAIDAELKLLLQAVTETRRSLTKFGAELERRV